MEDSEIVALLKEVKEKLEYIERNIKPRQDNKDIYDDEGVPWKNRATEYKRKLDNCLKKINKQGPGPA